MTYQTSQDYRNQEAKAEFLQEEAAHESQLAQDLGQEPTLEEKLAALGLTLDEFNASVEDLMTDW